MLKLHWTTWTNDNDRHDKYLSRRQRRCVLCLVRTTDTDKTKLSTCLVDGINRIGDKSRLFSNRRRILRLDKTVSGFSVADSLDLSPVLFTLPTRTRQDKTVLDCQCRRCEHNEQRVRCVFKGAINICHVYRLSRSFDVSLCNVIGAELAKLL